MLAGRGLQERFEASDVGRALISAFVIVTVVFLVATNMAGDSYLRQQVLRLGDPYLNALGLDQTWRVFAFDPRRTSIGFYARVRYADGSAGTWHVPDGSAVFGEYWDYRWRKWFENVIMDSRRDQLWRPAAQFVARQERDHGRRPVQVTLVRRYRELFAPGTPGPDRGRWRETAFFKLRVRS